MPANNGCDATFTCQTIEVVSVEPYTPEQRLRDGSIYAKNEDKEQCAPPASSTRVSNRWYLWAAASAFVIVADMVLHGVTGLNFFAAMLSIVFAVLMFSGKRAEDFVIGHYQELGPPVGRPTTMTPTTRTEILRLLEKSLWPAWFVLLVSCLMFRMVGDLNLSWALTNVMIVFVLAMTPLRIFIAAALFWPGSKGQRGNSA
jgi:hypothetical protein